MRVVLIFFIAFLVFYFNPIKAEINDYIYPHQKYSYSNYGGVGLIQNPTARFFKSGTLAVSLSHYDPYLRGSIIAYPFDWFEASYQYVEINNALYSSSKEFSGTQSLKDKSFDVKFKIINESNYLPQVAVGFRDIGGTGLFSSEYLVFNKFVSRNIDLSFGIGWGNLDSNEISNPLSKLSNRFESRNAEEGLGGKVNIDDLFSGDAGYFAGIEVFLPYLNGLRGKIEIDGTNYETESKVPLSQDSNINVGLIYPLNKDLDIKLSYARGNTLSFGFSYALGLGGKNPK